MSPSSTSLASFFLRERAIIPRFSACPGQPRQIENPPLRDPDRALNGASEEEGGEGSAELRGRGHLSPPALSACPPPPAPHGQTAGGDAVTKKGAQGRRPEWAGAPRPRRLRNMTEAPNSFHSQ